MNGADAVEFALGTLAMAAERHPDDLRTVALRLKPEYQEQVRAAAVRLLEVLPMPPAPDRPADGRLGPFGSPEMDGGYQA